MLYFCASGLVIAGSSAVTVGQNATISCSTNMNVEKVEWLYAGSVIAFSNITQVDLSLSPVFDYFHNREYICRATTSYGMLEKSIILSVQSKSCWNSINV